MGRKASRFTAYLVEKVGVKMLRPAHNRIILRVGLGVALLLVLVIALVGVWIGNRPDQGILDETLLDAIRDGDTKQVQHLLHQGANANTRDEAGDTALMRAALYADVEMMRLLVESGAEVQARAQDGTAPLL